MSAPQDEFDYPPLQNKQNNANNFKTVPDTAKLVLVTIKNSWLIHLLMTFSDSIGQFVFEVWK